MELRGFEPLTSSMRTLDDAGSQPLTMSSSAARPRSSGFTLGHVGSCRVHVSSRAKCYAKCYSGGRAESVGRRATGRIEITVNTYDDTVSNDPRIPTRFLTRSEAAQSLRRSTGTLANWAAQRKGPVYYRQEDGAVVYAIEDLAEWLAVQRVLPEVA